MHHLPQPDRLQSCAGLPQEATVRTGKCLRGCTVAREHAGWGLGRVGKWRNNNVQGPPAARACHEAQTEANGESPHVLRTRKQAPAEPMSNALQSAVVSVLRDRRVMNRNPPCLKALFAAQITAL
jgi:hypothetical protein